jgi:hypothetical protein
MKHKVDRKKFVEFFVATTARMTKMFTIREDLIKGGEFIITADDILKNLDTIPTNMVINYKGDGLAVLAKDCELVYVTK